MKEVDLGDVVCASYAIGYESGRDELHRFRPKLDVGQSTYALLQRAEVEAESDAWLARLTQPFPDARPRVRIGPIAAGEKVVASNRSEIAKFLCDTYIDALAVEMEGAGFLRAIYANPQVQGLVVRGISDRLTGKAQSDKKGWQDTASQRAAAFAFQVLANFD